MLIQLKINDFAIIKDLEISLQPGLNILSGETGAGKTIIINAVNLILGGRASVDLIRSGCKEARVEALFSCPESRPLASLLSEMEIPFEGELLIKRTISHEGRNRITVNGSMATLQMLGRLSGRLISISGQHEHQLLLKPENHLYLLDDFAGLNGERTLLAEDFHQYRGVKDEIRNLKQDIEAISAKQELAQFQVQEIEAAEIEQDEDQTLMEEKERLQHAEELRTIAVEGYQGLYENQDAVLSWLSRFSKGVEKAAGIDPRFAPVRDRLGELTADMEDLAFSLRDLETDIPMDSDRLEQVMERMELLNRLKRKYGPTLADVLHTREKLSAMIFDLGEKKERLAQFDQARTAMEAEIQTKAMHLSKKRKKAARDLEKAVIKELQYLHMKETRFLVCFNDIPTDRKNISINDTATADGMDRIEFLISPNVGEALKPLAKVASGGELSRIMLALKTILAHTGAVETIIFDEVDSGISGATAAAVGEKVLSLADFHQILCITHLPQIASKGKNHFLVKKEVKGGRTQTTISELNDEQRLREIARLLGGQKITHSALAHAGELLKVSP